MLTATLVMVAGGLAVVGPMSPEPSRVSSIPPFPDGVHHRPVFAHYFPPYPISIDDRDPQDDYYATEYLNPNGEKGIHSAYGGLLRDRPLPRPPRGRDDWRAEDLAEDIRHASSAGIDGFSVDILALHDESAWIAPIPELLLHVAEQTDPNFKIMLMPDMNGSFGTLSPQQAAGEIARLATSPAAFRLADGRLVVSPFIAEVRTAAWWRDFITAMKVEHGTAVALVPVFVDPSTENIEQFAPIAYGMSDWGARNPAANPVSGLPIDMIRRVHGLSKIWMQPVSVQDYRPRDQVYDEAQNTTNLRNTWQIAIDGRADWVQIVTWNDYSENTDVAPSARHGTALLELFTYYIAWFKTGRPPPILSDSVYLTHRTQLIGAVPAGRQAELADLRPGSSPGVDAVEAISMLAAPATVTLSVGSATTVCQVPYGVSTCVAPLAKPGSGPYSISVSVSRDGADELTLTSPYPVIPDPPVQDLSYTVSGVHSGAGPLSEPPR